MQVPADTVIAGEATLNAPIIDDLKNTGVRSSTSAQRIKPVIHSNADFATSESIPKMNAGLIGRVDQEQERDVDDEFAIQ
ncbi:MAG: hypothetical protein IPK76_16675 [Lewinellaceae bacterium]|nr:hypothetical protein [Lewinellaceae bacterium]